MDRKLLGNRIKEERLRIGLTQEQIAERINVSTTYIGYVERGERSITLEKLILLAECFHVTIDSLLHNAVNDEPRLRDNRIKSLWNSSSDKEKDLIIDIAEVVLKNLSSNQ